MPHKELTIDQVRRCLEWGIEVWGIVYYEGNRPHVAFGAFFERKAHAEIYAQRHLRNKRMKAVGRIERNKLIRNSRLEKDLCVVTPSGYRVWF